MVFFGDRIQEYSKPNPSDQVENSSWILVSSAPIWFKFPSKNFFWRVCPNVSFHIIKFQSTKRLFFPIVTTWGISQEPCIHRSHKKFIRSDWCLPRSRNQPILERSCDLSICSRALYLDERYFSNGKNECSLQ